MFRLRHSAALLAAAALGLAGGAVALGATGAVGHHSDALPFLTTGSSSTTSGDRVETQSTGTPDATETPEATGTPEPTDTPEATETPEAADTPEPSETAE